MSQYERGVLVVSLWGTIVALPQVCGCGDAGGPPRVVDTGGVSDCSVMVYTSIYTKESERFAFDVYWDGNKLFSGRTPKPKIQVSGLPAGVLDIRTTHGRHVLKIQRGNTSVSTDLELKKGSRPNYCIWSEGKGIGIESIELPLW